MILGIPHTSKFENPATIMLFVYAGQWAGANRFGSRQEVTNLQVQVSALTFVLNTTFFNLCRENAVFIFRTRARTA